MILVDTSIWIDHLRGEEPELVARLQDDAVGCHPYVIEELALGSIRARDRVLGLLADLHPFPVVTHRELLGLVDKRRLWGRGLSAVDTHLLGSVALVPGGQLWTRDRRLLAVAREVGIPCHDTQ